MGRKGTFEGLDMAELVWKGKHTKQQSSSEQHLYICESFDSLPANNQPDSFPSPTQTWYNRFILGGKRSVLTALLSEFAGQVNLIYIDPPFMTGRDFKSGSQLAYSDKWDNDLDAYLQWLYETFVLLRLLLAVDGSIYFHLYCRFNPYSRLLLDDIF